MKGCSMPGDSNISWTDKTWNPIAGCSIVSPGCTNCYAMQMAHRINLMKPDPASHYFGTTKVVNGNPVWTGVVNPAPDHILLAPLKWKKPARIFVNSMSDLFHEAVPDAAIDKVFAVMALSPQHTFQVLTKRNKRMREYAGNEQTANRIYNIVCDLTLERELQVILRAKGIGEDETFPAHLARIWLGTWPLPNVHLGVSCEDQQRADERIPDLLATPAAVRFVSAEPLLGPIDFTRLHPEPPRPLGDGMTIQGNRNALKIYNMPVLDQIIVGGESGHGHRPMQMEWAESIMRQCAEAGTAFFFKQDSGPRAGMKGRASDQLWACKQMPEVK
jgi:protein gp37